MLGIVKHYGSSDKVHILKEDRKPACGSDIYYAMKIINDSYTGSIHTFCGNCWRRLKVTVDNEGRVLKQSN